ncbi:hypothetical protein JYK14_15115 [Siccirubricoccus sp. KC 17139]|uniref:Uncharacterized protein n=1 Tax=Siccirubricoccus soli TaxID=2899147 RepID=A0ABT1D6E7_9PROT|nr:hypothetical protein [Siccirubricoccus soli]MCO6417481.1 hypothetical protein [Siccirubricoccus soli]MCP2683616.1 hypothetical protein [Siccirubricoccus soli]
MKRLALLVLPMSLVGCGHADSRPAHEAQLSLVGMTSADLQSCAGIPDKSMRIDNRTEIFTYTYKNDATGGVEIILPVIGGGYQLGGSGSNCSANMRLVDGRVYSVFYSGNNDRPVGTDGVCAPIIRGCMRRPQASMTPMTAETRHNVSAFSQPPAPPPPAPPPAPATDRVVRMEPVGR